MSTLYWRIAWWFLFAVWMVCAVLGMNHIRVGWLTSYGADVTVPGWLYIATRALDNPQRQSTLRRLLGRTPELAAGTIFLASLASELSQYYWPKGIFAGIFDSFDILAYAIGLAVCYLLDKHPIQQIRE